MKFYGSIREVAEILYKIGGSACSVSTGVRSTVPTRMPDGVRECSFIVALDSEMTRIDINVDAYGKWNYLRSNSEFFAVQSGTTKLVSRNGALKQGRQADCKVSMMNVLSHSDLGEEFQKRVFKLSNVGEQAHIALVSCRWLCEPYEFMPSAHGNAKKNLTPYFRLLLVGLSSLLLRTKPCCARLQYLPFLSVLGRSQVFSKRQALCGRQTVQLARVRLYPGWLVIRVGHLGLPA